MRLSRLLATLALVFVACSSGGDGEAPKPAVETRPAVRMRFARDDSFYSAPFPSEDLRGEDGHEVVFQTGAPKHQYRCFLASLLNGVPVVVPGGPEEAPCP